MKTIRISSIIRRKRNKACRLLAEKMRRLASKSKYRTIDFFLAQVSDESFLVNDRAQQLLGLIVPMFCIIDFRYFNLGNDFPKGSVCLILREEDASWAMDRGASVLITKRDLVDYPCIVCDNPLRVYAKLVRYFRNLKSDMSVTAVTGSIGKSTAKNMIGEVYKQKRKTFYTESNSNTKKFIGYALQHIPSWTEAFLQEVDESGLDETEWIAEMLYPDIVVITAIDKSHFQYFESADKIVENVCSITRRMKDDGAVIVNMDEFERMDLLNGRNIVTVSLKHSDADFYASDITMDSGGINFKVNVNATAKQYEVQLVNIYASHNVISALYAFAAGVCEGIAPEAIVKGLESFRTSGVRQNVLRDRNNVLIYADCYNAVGRSMKSAIDTCDLIPVKGKRIAVLGDVEETGSESDQMHRDIVRYVDNSRFDILLTVGEKMKKASGEVGVRNELSIKNFLKLEELCAELKSLLQKDDLVLFKASHAGRLDKVIRTLWPEMDKNLFDDPEEKFEKWYRNSLYY